jgi:hypothetical protein
MENTPENSSLKALAATVEAKSKIKICLGAHHN